MSLPSLDPQPVQTPHRPAIAPFNSLKHDRLCRIGLWLGVLGAALAMIPGFNEGAVVEQEVLGIPYFFESGAYIGIGLTFAILFVAAVLLPYAWARITGIGLLAVAAAIFGWLVIAARSDALFSAAFDITIGPAGTILITAFVVTTIGLVLALVGSPRMGRRAALNAAGEPVSGTSGYAVTSLVLSLCALLVGFTAPLGIAFAVAAFDDQEQSRGLRTGRGLAIAGLVVGIVIVVLGVLTTASLMGVADPATFEESSN